VKRESGQVDVFHFKGIISTGDDMVPLTTARFQSSGQTVTMVSDGIQSAVSLTPQAGELAQIATTPFFAQGTQNIALPFDGSPVTFSAADINGVLAASSSSSLSIYATNSGH